jgi:hypothetical protein
VTAEGHAFAVRSQAGHATCTDGILGRRKLAGFRDPDAIFVGVARGVAASDG